MCSTLCIHLVTFLFLLIFGNFVGVFGCDICHPSTSIACHSENVYSLCIDGFPTRDYIPCPADYVCTGDHLVCYPKQSATPSCNRPDVEPSLCGICASTEGSTAFACIDETRVAFCFDGAVPSKDAITECPAGMVCDLNSEQFCSLRSEAQPSCVPPKIITTEPPTTTIRPTTLPPPPPTTTVPPPTPAPPTTVPPTTPAPPTPVPPPVCGQLSEAHPNKNDPTCRSYFLCGDDNGQIVPKLRDCSNGRYFDESKARCVVDKPTGCV